MKFFRKKICRNLLFKMKCRANIQKQIDDLRRLMDTHDKQLDTCDKQLDQVRVQLDTTSELLNTTRKQLRCLSDIFVASFISNVTVKCLLFFIDHLDLHASRRSARLLCTHPKVMEIQSWLHPPCPNIDIAPLIHTLLINVQCPADTSVQFHRFESLRHEISRALRAFELFDGLKENMPTEHILLRQFEAHL